ncbi:hypothetical protein GCM10010207_60900 [Streptomyces atratus]|nr:hypothetical protein GCM10010207_60900 [Streptomyces atratus]
MHGPTFHGEQPRAAAARSTAVIHVTRRLRWAGMRASAGPGFAPEPAFLADASGPADLPQSCRAATPPECAAGAVSEADTNGIGGTAVVNTDGRVFSV